MTMFGLPWLGFKSILNFQQCQPSTYSETTSMDYIFGECKWKTYFSESEMNTWLNDLW